MITDILRLGIWLQANGGTRLEVRVDAQHSQDRRDKMRYKYAKPNLSLLWLSGPLDVLKRLTRALRVKRNNTQRNDFVLRLMAFDSRLERWNTDECEVMMGQVKKVY